jgi:anti-sigma-K factor RskA
MTCEELKPEYGAYALGIAEDPERSEIAEHLARQCPICAPGVRSAMELVSAMSGAVKPVDPPKRLRAKVVGMVGAPPRRRWSVIVPWALAGALAIILLSVVVPGRLNRPVPEQKLAEALAVLNDPTAKDVSFGEPAARGRIFVSPGKGVVLIASHMPALDASKTFELWLIPAQGNPIPAGTFAAGDDATALYVHPGPIDNAAAVAVTVEPKGGSPQPTTKPFIVTKL